MNLKKDGYGRTELSYAIIDHKIQEALLLLKQDMDVNDSDNGGHSYLFFAAQECEIEVVDALLKLGADPNIETLSAVLFASQKYSVDQAYQIVKLLLAAGANPDHKNRRGVSIRQLSKRLAPGKISSYICSYQ